MFQQRLDYFFLDIFLCVCVNCCLLILVNLKINQQCLWIKIIPMQKAPTRQKQVLIEPSLGSHFNLLEKWTVIPGSVFAFYFTVAPGLLFAEPRPILLKVCIHSDKKTQLFLSV